MVVVQRTQMTAGVTDRDVMRGVNAGTLEHADLRWSDCYAGRNSTILLQQEDEGLACTTLYTL